MTQKNKGSKKSNKQNAKKKNNNNRIHAALDAAIAKQPSIGRQILAGGGNLLGSAFGGPVGGRFGSQLGNTIATVLGMGDYEVRQNSLASSQVPSMHKQNETTTIRHREYLGEVVTGAAGAFTATPYSINPGLATTFPWLSSIAQQYQEYSMKGLIFEFVSTSGDALNSTNTALGSVMMTTNYRSTGNPPASKLQVLNEYFSTDSKPSENFVHWIECDPKENPYNVQYIRGAPVPNGEDIKTYDLGTTYICTAGFQAANVTVGELWCTYEVELRKPTPTDLLNVYGRSAHYRLTGVGNASNQFGTSRTSTALNTDGSTQQMDNIGLAITGDTITFPAGTIGNYLVYYTVVGTSVATVNATYTYTNCSSFTPFANGGNAFSVSGGMTGSQYFLCTILCISNPSLVSSFKLNGGTFPTAATSADLFVCQWNGEPSTANNNNAV